jgi:hypothetical protein
MYSLFWFLAAANAWVILRMRYGASARRLVGLWVLIGAAGLLTHYLFGLVWAACAGWLLVKPGRLRRRTAIVGMAATLLLALPWFVLVALAAPSWRVTKDWMLLPWLTSTRGRIRDLVDLPLSYLSGHGPWIGPAWGRRAAVTTAILLGGLFWWRLKWRLFRGRRQLLWLWLIAALAGPLASDALLGTYSVAQTRYALAGLPAAMALLGLLLSRLRWSMAVPLLLLLAIPWFSGNRTIFVDRAPWEPFAQVGQHLDTQAQPGDLVIVHSIPSGVTLVARYMRSDTPMLSWVGQLGQRRVPEDVQASAAGHRRVVVVVLHEVGEPAPEEAWLRSHGRVEQEIRVGSGRIVYVLPSEGDQFGAAGHERGPVPAPVSTSVGLAIGSAPAARA